MPIDMSQAKAPPVKRGPGRPRNTPAPVVSKTQKYQSTLEDLRDLLVAGLMMGGMDADAGALQVHTPAAMPVYAELAEEIEPFGKFLDGFDQVGGKWVKLAMVSAPIVLQLLANHGMIKPAYGGMFNTQPPELLRATVQLKKAEMAQQVKEATDAANAEAQRMMAQLEDSAA